MFTAGIVIVVAGALIGLATSQQPALDQAFVKCLKEHPMALMFFNQSNSRASNMQLAILEPYKDMIGGYNCSDPRNDLACGSYNFFPVYLEKDNYGIYKQVGVGPKTIPEIMVMLNCSEVS